MRRSPREEGERWLEQAEADLFWTDDLARRGGYHLACFLAQQVAEKALKGLLYARGADIVLGHSVERLSAEAVEGLPDLRERARRWSVLDGYYVPTRYPNSLPDGIPARVYTAEVALEAAALARDVVQAVREHLGSGPANPGFRPA